MDTPYLEGYLRRKSAPGSAHQDLLWKYYVHQRRFGAAAKKLWQLAEAEECARARAPGRTARRPFPTLTCALAAFLCRARAASPNVSIDQRLDYLTRALTAAKSAPPGSAEGLTSQELQELEETAEVATIQKQIYDAMVATNASADDLRRLSAKLYDVSEVGAWPRRSDPLLIGRLTVGPCRPTALPCARQLYNDFTARLRLSECSLALLHVSANREPELVEQLWRDIIRRAPNVESLVATVAHLGRKFALSDAVFPVPGLVYLLEQRAMALDAQAAEPGWAVRALAEAGVPYAQLFDVYRRIADRAEWKAEEPFVHLMRSVLVLVDRWLQPVPVGVPRYGHSLPAAAAGAEAHADVVRQRIRGRSGACRQPFAAKEVDDALTQYIARAEQLRSAAGRVVADDLKTLHRRLRAAF